MADRAHSLRHVEYVMGTVFSFDIRDRPTPAIRRALDDAVRWLHHVDAVFSTYRPDSAISRLGRGESGPGTGPAEVREVLDLCGDVTRVSRGWFSATPGGVLDPSGLVKGWAVEAASQLLHESGATNTCVNGGGDLQLRGEARPGVPWRIGIAHPLRRGALATVVSGSDLAVATSGTAERGAHILDPHTGTPALGLVSITVVGQALTLTDAFATAAFAMGGGARGWLESLEGYEALAITPDGREWRTSGFGW